jgi:hypothetical protein
MYLDSPTRQLSLRVEVKVQIRRPSNRDAIIHLGLIRSDKRVHDSIQPLGNLHFLGVAAAVDRDELGPEPGDEGSEERAFGTGFGAEREGDCLAGCGVGGDREGGEGFEGRREERGVAGGAFGDDPSGDGVGLVNVERGLMY